MYYKIEQLKNILASHKNHVFSLDHLCSSALEYIQHLEAGIDRCYELAKRLESAQPKWISVEERLPEDDVNVLIYAASEKDGVDSVIAITNYTHSMHGFNIEGWRSPWQYCFWERKVTHWMPLPEAPKEEA